MFISWILIGFPASRFHSFKNFIKFCVRHSMF
nr:MAG TPA: hypothetical protein [Caudoviricetes sp.]